jgi:hypothetical protein
MKKITTLFVLLLAIAIPSLAQNCQNPISATVYQTGFNNIAIQQGDQNKLIRASRFVSDKCLLSSQVKNIALLFNADSTRMEFCRTAYAHTYDPANFYDVYDAFRSFSYALRLYNFVQTTTTTIAPEPTATEITFPAYAYPDIAGYTGVQGCVGPVMAESAFKLAAKNVYAQPTDESKYVAIQTVVEQNCLSFAQSMKLSSLLQTNNFKLKTMMYAFPKVYDQAHYQSGIVLFNEVQAQNEWTAFATNYLKPPPPVCVVSEEDLKGVLQAMRNKKFTDEKLSILGVAGKDRCFSVAQIKTIGKEFTFGSERLRVFKMLYEKCNDKENYFKLVDELSFDSEKDELKKFINNGGK